MKHEPLTLDNIAMLLLSIDGMKNSMLADHPQFELSRRRWRKAFEQAQELRDQLRRAAPDRRKCKEPRFVLIVVTE